MLCKSLMIGLLAGAALGGVMGAASAQTRPMTPAEGRHQPYKGRLPACDDQRVTQTIQNRFIRRETAYWSSGLEIERISAIRETGLRSAGLDLIPRRYCSGHAKMNDGKIRRVTWWIGERLGFAGSIGLIDHPWGIEWCVEGLDHHLAYAPGCRGARP